MSLYKRPFLHTVSKTGVKQGCILSPTLSNIYQNDIHDIFTEDCHPVKLGDIIFNTVSWADDLVTISTSRCGLQNCLNKLQEYCDKWQLEIKISKTKVMVLSIGCSQLKDIHINGETLECVSNYTYLGLMGSRNGNVSKMEENWIKQARNAMFAIKHAISSSYNISVQLSLPLLDKQIEQILLYGSPVWGIPISNRAVRLKLSQTNTKQLKSEINKALSALNAGDTEIISYRYCKSMDDILITLNNVVDKAHII